MSKHSKLLEQFLTPIPPKDFRWADFVTLLVGMGFRLEDGGGSSHCKFVYLADESIVVTAFRPHPGNELPVWYIKQVKTKLRELGIIENE